MLSAPPEPMHQMRFRCARGELVVSVGVDPPSWLAPTGQALVDLLDLASDWDSYGAWAVEPSHVCAAFQVLLLTMRHDTPAPAVVPTNRGHVQLEWHVGGIDLEIETLSMQRLLVSFEDASSGDEWEGEVVSDLTPLVEYIGQLS